MQQITADSLLITPKLLIWLLFFAVLFADCTTAKAAEGTATKAGCDDTLKNKWATYEKLNTLIAEKKFESIPKLFSKKYRKAAEAGIRDFREFWLQAWTMNHLKAMTKRLRLKKDPTLMVCEEGEWKINEK